MAGAVKGLVMNWRDGTYSVLPDSCPVDDVHRIHEPACFTVHPDQSQRACPYWIATTAPANATDRRHPSVLHVDAVALGARTINCQILCLQARRNRPPGA